MADLPFQRIGIVGLGLMGGSLARSLKALRDPPHIRAYSSCEEDLEQALEAGAIDAAVSRADEAVPGCDFIVYAAHLAPTMALLREHAPLLDQHVTVTDLSSLKVPVLDTARKAGLAERFVGSHPMAGGEGSGFAASRGGLYQEVAVWIVEDGADPERVAQVTQFWEALGARPYRISAEEHDRRMAWVSHLPQLAATALSSVLAEAGIQRADLGRGGRDMTRLGGSSPEMWGDLLARAPSVLPEALSRLEDALGELRRIVETGEVAELRGLMARTRRWATGPGSDRDQTGDAAKAPPRPGLSTERE